MQEIADSAYESHLPEKEITFHKRIVQIEFNAWHFVDSDLWSSLVAYIFANLGVRPDDAKDLIQSRQEQCLRHLQELEGNRKRLVDQEQKVKDELEEAKNKLKEIEKEKADAQGELAKLTAAGIGLPLSSGEIERLRNILTEAGVSVSPELSEDPKALYQALVDTYSIIKRSSSVLAPLLQAPNRTKRLLYLMGIVAALPIMVFGVGWLVSLLGANQLAPISAAASGVAWLLGVGADWIRRQADWTSKQLDELEREKQHLDQEYAGEIAAQQETVQDLTEEYLDAQKKKKQLQGQIDELKTKLDMTPAQVMNEWIKSRAASDDYRKHLGIVALVRQDFEDLSKFLTAVNQEVKEENAGFNRIVLYIDDLDRCPPDKVLQVLQAVHLLLAFPAFIVVVAVDARWLSQSLLKQYPDLLVWDEQHEHEGEQFLGSNATPHDYLEKIFQIPFWIAPMGEAGSKNMLTGLLENVPRSEEPSPNGEPERGTGHDGRKESIDSQLGKEVSSNPEVSGANGGRQVRTETGSDVQFDPKAEGLKIEDHERDFMKQLAPILGRSPRAVKRFFNVYQLIKIRYGNDGSFLAKNGSISNFQLVLFLLGLVTGMPTLSRNFFNLVLNDGHGPVAMDIGRLMDQLNPTKHDTDARKKTKKTNSSELRNSASELFAEWNRLSRWLDSLAGQPLKTVNVDKRLAEWAPYVARYSFGNEPDSFSR